jgi:hypothetical protein
MSSQDFFCRNHGANLPQVRNRRYSSLVTTWTKIALVKFRHPAQFQSLIVSRHRRRFSSNCVVEQCDLNLTKPAWTRAPTQKIGHFANRLIRLALQMLNQFVWSKASAQERLND